jgi:dTDP-4-dehydrorhamnose reductase
MLGRDLCATAPAGFELLTPSSSELDITSAESVRRAIEGYAPDYVVNAAAYTQVDRAESDPVTAVRVNAAGPGLIGAACSERGIPVVHFSTDYVFSGSGTRPYRETDPADPMNVYGRTKLAGEQALLASGAPALILRTAWLFGREGKSFPRTMWERARGGLATRVVNDQWGRPTSTRDLAAATWALIEAGARGIVHVSNSGEPTTWFGIAERIFERAGVPGLLEPCGTEDFPTPARRPRYSVLDTGRVTDLLGHGLPDWPDSLDRFLVGLDRAGTLD